MKTYRGRRGIAPLILNLSSRWRSVLSHPNSFIPWERAHVPTEHEVEWGPEPVWMIKRREFLAPTRI